MEHVIPLFLGFLGLFLVVFVGRWLIAWYRTAIHEGSHGNDAVQSMLTNLQRSLDLGEISVVEYRTIKAELMARLREQMDQPKT